MSPPLQFGDYTLDQSRYRLQHGERPVPLEKIPMELLIFLAERRGELVTREEIAERLWGKEVFVDVDHGINTAIRKVRRALRDDPDKPRYVETVVGKGYRFAAPIASSNGESQQQALQPVATPIAEPAPGPDRRRRWLWVLAATAAVLVIAAFGVRHVMRTRPVQGQTRLVIAVAPFQNLSGEPAEDYFASGLTEEILTQLGQLNPERIGVIRYRSPGSALQASRAAAAQFLLQGGVRRQGQRVRVSVQLVRVADGTEAWTEFFDRSVGDVLSLESEVADGIARQLEVKVLAQAPHKPVPPEAVEAYFRGRAEMEQLKVPVPDAARAHLERAIALDPSYASAYAGLADFYSARAVINDAGSQQNWQLAERYATQALSLDDKNAETHAALADIKLLHDWDWQAARQHAERALQLNPSLPEAHAAYARYLRVAGNMQEAVNQRKQALALDPFRDDLKHELRYEQYFARDFQPILTESRATLANDPGNIAAQGDLCAALEKLRRFDEAAPECVASLRDEGHPDWAQAFESEYRRHGYEAARLLVAKLELKQVLEEPQPDLWNLANAYVAARMRQETLQTLLRGLPTHEPGLLQVRVDPDFDYIRNDPQYAELVHQIGFPTP